MSLSEFICYNSLSICRNYNIFLLKYLINQIESYIVIVKRMEDISDLPQWQPDKVLQSLKDNPLTIKNMKIKLDKIYAINSYNEREYLVDLVDAWAWVKLAAETEAVDQMFQNEKAQKFFIEEFIFTSIKYMELCRSFKLLEMMVYTQQLMAEALRLFMRFFDQLEKYPRMTLILKHTFDFEKQFFKVNYSNQYHNLILLPTKQEIEETNAFMSTLKPGDRVDVLKTEHHSKRVCWLPGTFIKASALYIYVRCDNDRTNLNIDLNTLQLRPLGSKKQEYQWRLNLKAGDKIDYLKDANTWMRSEIEQVRENQQIGEKTVKFTEVKIKDDNQYWLSISDPKIQKFQSVTRMRSDGRQEQQYFYEDYNDYILDPQMKQTFVTRSEVSKSLMIIDLLTFAHKELHLFERISKVVAEKSMKIEVVADLINFILIVNPLFHRKFAVDYLISFTQSILEYINNGKEGTIRNFSKERYEAVMNSLQQFMKRMYPISERKTIVQKLQLDLILRFLFSDFLDRKLQAVSLLTNFFKMCRHNVAKKTLKSFVEWIKENKILLGIYSDKSHSQLISKSSDFLKYYLETNPSIEELQPLLIWNEAIIKLVAENFDDIPTEIQNTVVQKIKSKSNVTNIDALSIIKKTPGCEAWLLQNGGQCWVQVVREKTKRKAEIAEVFKQPFPVVNKITKEMNELFESNFKNTYFTYMFDINYLCTVLENDQITLSEKLEFITLATDLIKKINDQVFDLLLKFLIAPADEKVAEKYQKFFVSIMPKLHISHLERLFEQKFSNRTQLENLTDTQLTIFEKCFIGINDGIEQQTYGQVFSTRAKRKKSRSDAVLTENIQQLFGIQKLEQILFYSKNAEISKRVIKFIGMLLMSVKSEEMKEMAQEYISKLLQIGESLLYAASEEKQEGQNKLKNQEKYLKIIEQLLNQTETKGVDQVVSVNALFPAQKIQLKLIDNFNSNRTKIYLSVPSNMTLFQFRSQICKHINAYVPQTKLFVNGKQLSDRYNGHVIHVLDLNGDITIGKVQQTPRINLTDHEGRLVDKAKIIFKKIFKEYSSFGLMSKKQCLKYHQKCVGEVQSQGEVKVDKIFDQFDKDRDGYLTQTDFLSFYEISSRTKEISVWNNLEAFGVRNDLQILDALPIEYPDRDQLARNKLYDNEKFMKILFELLASPTTELAKAAWNLAARLPLYTDFNIELDVNKEYQLRYWLYLTEHNKQFEKITTETLEKVLNMSKETACIGLKVTHECKNIDVSIFNIITENLNKSNSIENLSFFDKVILDYSLKIFAKFLIRDKKIAAHYVANEESLNKIFRQGILSRNSTSREAYCHTLSQLIKLSVTKQFKLFESLFKLVYRIFDNCELSTLTIDYFELFSHLLEILREHADLMSKLGLNWGSLTQEIIEIYKSHECTESSMTSKPDQVAEGLLKIIAKLLNQETIDHIVNLVPFIFQQSLFPEKGRNKLKTAKSRQDAYELIYEICKFKTSDGHLSKGLQKLFEAGFKDIYKKMSAKKSNQIFSYYYSYNQSRSELGYAGIRNLGCICYMISMLQQLYMTTPFRNLTLIADDGEPECLVKRGTKEIDDNIFHQLKTMFGYLLLTEKQEYNPDELCFSFKDFEGQPVNTSVQQDAQQFINIFFDKLETSLKNTPFKNIFQNVFGGKTCSQTTCSGCGAVKQRSENFYPLSLEIKGFKNINESFNKYITGEVISDYQCDTCKNKCDVTKRSFLQKTPNYFIIHLQRMCFNYDRLENEKVNSRWEFPQQLNVYPYTLSKQKNIPQNNSQFTYKLKGVVVHYGTADFGHYFSYIKQNQATNQWIEFNDERVREFDPSDIEIECFGGEHWRRESQSAYLLMYERVNKSNVVLEFNSAEEKKKILEQYKLMPAIVEELQESKNQSESQVSKVESVNQQMSEEKEKQEQVEKLNDKQVSERTENAEQKPKDSKILVHLDMSKIGQYVPKNIKDKIDQENDEFSFTMNLSNNQFAAFIHHILSINPPENLREEYLELCYECLNLKQTIKVSQNKTITVSEWASERFTELIQGHGWEFMKNFGQNWESDILNIQKSTRTTIKCLLQCAVNDIIKSNNFNDELSEQKDEPKDEPKDELRENKRKVIISFLDKLEDMMLNQVVKHWTRFADYFQLWIGLIKESAFVRRYCEEKMIVEKILDFVMENGYPYQRAKKRHPMGSQYHSAQFEYPLTMMHVLLENGYELNEMEEKCFKTYAFMDKIISHRVEGANIIQTLCKNNSVISQKMGFLLLNTFTNVQQSDQAKPIIASMHEYLKIDDDLKKRRIQWIIGFPTYVQHARDKGFGSYGCIPSTEPAVNYLSALGAPPILQQIMKFKKKSQQITVLLISMVLQLEHDGYINNLDEYPSKMALQKCYTAQFQSFVRSYYEQTQRPFTAKSYIQYGIRVKRLWQQRPNRPMIDPFPRILLGKTIEQVLVKEQTVQKIYEIRQYNIKTYYLPLDSESAANLTGKNIVTIKNNSNFICPNLPKPTKSFGHYSFMRVNSSDEEDNEDVPQETVFDAAKQGWLLRKIEIINRSSEDMLSVFGVDDDSQCNLHVPFSPLSVQIESNSKSSLILIKKDLNQDYGELNIVFNILGKATDSGYMPRQIITQVDQKVEYSKVNSSDQEEQQCSNETFN